MGLQSGVVIPADTSSLLQDWASNFLFHTKKSNQTWALWKMLPKFTLWGLWMERNNRLFRKSKITPGQVATKIQAFMGESALYHNQFKRSRVPGEENEQWLTQFKIQSIDKDNCPPRIRSLGNSEKMNKNLIIGKQRSKTTFCSLMEPLKETQAW